MIIEEIRTELNRLQDVKYREMQIRTIPTVSPETIIGVRTHKKKKMARELLHSGQINLFLNDLPHRYFEENQLHAFLISGTKDYSECIRLLDLFLPYVNNWATCDQMSPGVFRKHRNELINRIPDWLDSSKPYVIRFGIGMLMQHFLDEDFDRRYAEMVAAVRSEEYYVNMMIAWYFATALAKQYDAAVPFLENRYLDRWTHNKTIQKAIESYRIPPDRKEYLRSLRIHSQAFQ